MVIKADLANPARREIKRLCAFRRAIARRGNFVASNNSTRVYAGQCFKSNTFPFHETYYKIRI